jgi:hypothetical protein
MEYSDGDIRTWAKQIRENKIRDLKIIVDYFERELKNDLGNVSSIYYIHGKQRIIELRKKLDHLILSA